MANDAFAFWLEKDRSANTVQVTQPPGDRVPGTETLPTTVVTTQALDDSELFRPTRSLDRTSRPKSVTGLFYNKLPSPKEEAEQNPETPGKASEKIRKTEPVSPGNKHTPTVPTSTARPPPDRPAPRRPPSPRPTSPRPTSPRPDADFRPKLKATLSIPPPPPKSPPGQKSPPKSPAKSRPPRPALFTSKSFSVSGLPQVLPVTGANGTASVGRTTPILSSQDTKMADDIEEELTQSSPPRSAPATLETTANHRNSTSSSSRKLHKIQESGFISYWNGPLDTPTTNEDKV